MKTRDKDQIVLAHGGGGELTRRLIAERIMPRLANPLLDPLLDSALLPEGTGRLCFTTDSFVVQPLEFPGGDIGRLAVCGTVNDLAVMGSRPIALSLALVMEEGLPMAVLDRVLDSVASAAAEAGAPVATGDTKVVERGRGDGLIITTAGVGTLLPGAAVRLDARRIASGDAILVTGRLAEHGLAVMCAREGLGIETAITSDVAPLAGLAEVLFSCGADVKFMRDPTRGGLAGVLADLVEAARLSVEVDAAAVPLSAAVRHVAEALGLDPLAVANEGKIVAVVAAQDAAAALAACRAHPLGRGASLIGRFTAAEPPLAELVTEIGGRVLIQRPYGEELPRIC